MNTKNLLKALPIIIGLGLFISCGQKKEEAVVQTEAVVKVKTATASTRMVDEKVTYTATVKAEVSNNIIPALGGRIENIFVEVGQKVSKGQPLAQMEPHNLDQQKAQVENARRDYERYNELLKVGGIAQQQVDQAKMQLDILESSIDKIKTNTLLRSPINGVVTKRNYDKGDVFGQEPILVVEQLNPVKAIINVSESYFPMVKVGMPVDITVDIYGDEVFSGKIALIEPVIDPVTHTFAVEVAINNKNGKIAPGMYSRVTLNFGAKEQVIIPDIAVVKQSGSNDRYVYIVDGDKARYNKVLLGKRLEENVVILSGVANGEVVVTAGQTRLIDGSQIEIVNE